MGIRPMQACLRENGLMIHHLIKHLPEDDPKAQGQENRAYD